MKFMPAIGQHVRNAAYVLGRYQNGFFFFVGVVSRYTDPVIKFSV